MDNVLHAPEGDIHYHIYVPETYDGSEPYALFLTLPGYEGLYFQGMGQNLYSENFAFEALNYNDHMIVAAPQLSDWGETSAEQTIALTEYLLGHYNIDQERVYTEGYPYSPPGRPDAAPCGSDYPQWMRPLPRPAAASQYPGTPWRWRSAEAWPPARRAYPAGALPFSKMLGQSLFAHSCRLSAAYCRDSPA